ncbi:peptide deformylase [Paraferrimonas sp. SM1919]|uniref:peptide deformylase n=1 Tax=Paraferrimonas sp. SM1919 TaxID=2662263 RepID=UPI0013CF72B2|nr:peptide deformylase [Paraferrimonas sp. SM1919]
MAILEVLRFPDERLRTKAQPVTEFNDEIKTLVKDMLDTMYEEKGIGLAATQVNVHQQVVVMDHSEDRNEPMVFINPELTDKTGKFKNEEGCLSVPGIYEKVERWETVTIKYFDEHGEQHEKPADELLSICIQHEMDHLEGILFIDHLSPLKRQRAKAKLEKMARQAAKHG